MNPVHADYSGLSTPAENNLSALNRIADYGGIYVT